MNTQVSKEAKEQKLICICCPIGCELCVSKSETGYVVTGNKCPRGKQYAIAEMTAPTRIITSTVKIQGGIYPVIPVKTFQPIPKDKIFAVMEILNDVTVTAPTKIGDVIVRNVAGTGVDVIATKDMV